MLAANATAPVPATKGRAQTGDGECGIFRAVHQAYAENAGRALSNEDLYREVASRAGMTPDDFDQREPVGQKGAKHSTRKRAARWTQQTMRQRGLLRRVEGKRGMWELTEIGKQKLSRLRRGETLVAFSTKLGVALWGDCRDALRGLGEPIHLCVTSPPYALAKPRGYGNPTQDDYVDWLCTVMEPVVKALAPGGSIVLNLGNEIFIPSSAARSLIPERVMIAMHDRLGLHKMDTLIWHNPNKPPGPVRYASLTRVHLNAGYEPLLWLTNDPSRVMSNNRRVLMPHTDRHLRFMESGGERAARSNSDGAYKVKEGSYGRQTEGRIPRNVLSISSTCASQREYKRRAAELGLPTHGAPFPLALAKFLVEFLTAPGQLAVDNMAGSCTLPLAAEQAGRRWLAFEQMGEYLAGGSARFENADVGAAFEQAFPMLSRKQRSLF